MNQHSISWISIILFAILVGSASSQNQQQAIYSQANEKVTLGLYNYFNTIRSDITIQPKSGYASVSSGAQIVSQASVSKQNNLQTFVGSGQIQVSSTTSVRIEVSTSDYLNYRFDYLLITLQADNSIQVATTSTNTLTLQTPGVIHGISFSTSLLGYFSVNTPINKNLNYIGSFTYSDTNGLSVTISQTNIPLKQIKPYYFGGNQYLIFTAGSSLGLATPDTTDSGYQYSFLTTNISTDCIVSSFLLSPMYPILICQTAQLTYKLSAFYYIDDKLTQVVSASSSYGTALFTNIYSSQALNGIIYLFSSDTINSNRLQVTQILFDQSNAVLTSQTFSVIVPQGYLSYNLPMYIQEDNLLVCFTATSVLGYNIINGVLLFERNTYSALNSELLKIVNFQATYQLVYQSTQDTTSTTAIQYVLSIPAFTFMLTSGSPSYYVLYASSDMLTLTVVSYLLQFKIDQCTYMKTTSIVFDGIINAPSKEGLVRYNIEQVVSCSNLELGQPYIWMNDEFYDVMWSIKTISQLTNTLPINNLPPTNYQIYPTQGSSFLVVAGMVTSLTGISTGNKNKNSFSLTMSCSESFLGAPLKVDINGFYSYQGSSLYQQIAILFQQPGTIQDNCNFPTITTTCLKKDSKTNQNIPFLFASDTLQAKVFSLCNTQLTTYSYQLSQFSLTVAPTQISFTLSALPTQAIAIAGKLFISDGKTFIVIYHYNIPQSYYESINIPQTLGVIQNLVLYSHSYLLRVTDTDSTTIVYVLPYSNNASPLRTLQFQGYQPNFSTATPIYQTLQLPTVINDSQSLPQMQEYYILPAINATSIQSVLVFRINHVTAENQLQKIIDLKATLQNNKIFASSSGYLGFVDSSNKGYLYSLNYMMVLQFNIGIVTPNQAFTTQPMTSFSAYFKLNTGQYIYPQIYLFKDVSAANAVVDQSNTEVSSLVDYFSEFITLSQTETIDANLTSAIFSNVFGWLPSQKGLNSPVQMILSNRVTVTIQDPQVNGLFDTLYLLDKVTIISYKSTVQISSTLIDMMYLDPYLFYDPVTMTNTTQKDSNGNLIQTIITVSIYSIASDYENLKQCLLNMQITATYKPSLQTPSLQIAASTLSRNAPDLNYDETITRIQSDPKLGLILLKKTKQQMAQTVCLLKIIPKSFSIDCDSLSVINSLGILDVIWIEALQLNVFISSNNILYTGFTLNGGSTGVFALDLYYKTSFMQSSFNFKTIALAGSIRSNSILISYDKINAVEFSVTSSYQGDPFDVTPLNVYLGENNLQLTGQGTTLSDSETLLLAVDIENNIAYELVYSFYSTGDPNNVSYYNIIRATGGQSVQDITIFNGQAKISPIIDPQNESLQILLNCYPGEDPLGIVFSVSPQITISLVDSNGQSDYDGVGGYLALQGTVMNQSNSITLNIDLGQSNHPYKSGLNLEFTLWIVILLILQ